MKSRQSSPDSVSDGVLGLQREEEAGSEVFDGGCARHKTLVRLNKNNMGSMLSILK
jgi:hypothetical protein